MSKSGGFLCCLGCKESPHKETKQSNENLVTDNTTHNKKPKEEQSNRAFDSNSEQQTKAKGVVAETKIENAQEKSTVSNNTLNTSSIVLEEKTSVAQTTPVTAAPPSSEELTEEMAAELSGLIARLEAVTNRLESCSGGGGGASHAAAAPEVLTASVQAYDDIFKGQFATFLSCSAKIGGDCKTQADIVKKAFEEQRAFLIKASKCKEPSQQALQTALQPTSVKIQEIQDFREKNRGSAFFNHLSAISESIPALGWVAVSPTPAPFAKEMADAGQFYGNRVLKEFKEKDKTHVEWVKSWNGTMSELQAFIKQHHTTGLVWNKQGVDISSVSSGAAPAGAPAPPPPGPPPPPMKFDTPAPASTDSSDAKRSQLFAELNKGSDITKALKPSKGLKKVSDDQKTHKNPDLRLGPKPFKASPTGSPKPFKPFGGAGGHQQVKPARTELEGKKWMVEHHQGNRSIVIENTEIKQTVYIYKCINSTIQVKGKVNSITVDNCKKTAIVFDNLVSVLEFINCQSVQAQVNGVVPIVSIDKTDGCQVYLSKNSVSAEIVTAKSSEMNILIPDASGEFKEYAVPEQYKTIFNGTKLVTEVADIAS